MNKAIRIFQYDDQEMDLMLVSHILEPISDFYELEVIPDCEKNAKTALEKLTKNDYDLIILDMVDAKLDQQVGFNLLDCILRYKPNSTVWVYTGKSPKEIDFRPQLEKYTFVREHIFKSPDTSEVKEAFTRFLEGNNYVRQIFRPYDENDFFLKADILTIGKNELNTLLMRIKKKKHLEASEFIINPLASGYSGAFLFRVTYLEKEINHKSFLIKLSADISSIRSEYENVEKYGLLPYNLRLGYDTKISFEDLNTGRVAGMLIEFADDTKTLFDYIKNAPATSGITRVLGSVFTENGMNKFYSENKSKEKKKYDYLFESFDERRQSLLMKSTRELQIILNNLPGKKIDEQMITGLIHHKIYKKIDYNYLTGSSFLKHLILCHGDFHAKNILVSNVTGRPVIIDTGGIGYHFWATDISRLIAHLAIEGLNNGTIDYYDINKINPVHETISAILFDTPPADLTGPDLNFATAIRWLINNAIETYGEFYTKWELYLSLAIEFFKFSYRSGTVPISKRCVALLTASDCILKANEVLDSRPPATGTE